MFSLTSLYSPNYASSVVYMMQKSKYRAGPFLKQYWRTSDFSEVGQGGQLKRTKAVKWLILGLTIGMLIQVLAGLVFVVWGIWFHLGGGTLFGLALIVSYPVVWSHVAAGFLALRQALKAS